MVYVIQFAVLCSNCKCRLIDSKGANPSNISEMSWKKKSISESKPYIAQLTPFRKNVISLIGLRSNKEKKGKEQVMIKFQIDFLWKYESKCL